MSYLIKYQKKEGSRGSRRVTLYKIGGEWVTAGREAKRVGRTEKKVRASIDSGRPTSIRSFAYKVVGGPHHGEWMTCPEVADVLNVGIKVAESMRDVETGALNWRIPRARRPNKKIKVGLDTNEAATLFAKLPRTA